MTDPSATAFDVPRPVHWDEAAWQRLRALFETEPVRTVVLSKPRKEADAPARRDARAVEVRGERMLQWTHWDERAQSHENLPLAASLERIGQWYGALYLDLTVTTDGEQFTFRSSKKGRVSVQARRIPEAAGEPSALAHNRAKSYLLPEGEPVPFLQAIGVMTDAGHVRAKRYAKFKQINRFLEFVDDVAGELPSRDVLRIVDFGAGKSYLTFAVEHYFRVIRGRRVEMLAVDQNASIIADCRRIARDLNLATIRFERSSIAEAAIDGPIDLAVSLHACDTATDEAIARAVLAEASVLLAVPCCQHELRSQIESASLRGMLKHGLFQDRLAAMATDALRSAALDLLSYRTQVLEFIDMEHTPKNVLIRAVRRRGRPPAHAAASDYRQLRLALGVKQFALERLLPELAECVDAV